MEEQRGDNMPRDTARLTLRPFEKRDFGPLAELVATTWLRDFPGRPGELASTVELCDYLSQTTWSLVAEQNGTLLGAILLHEKDREVAEERLWRRRGLEAERAAAVSSEAALAVGTEMAGVIEGSALAREYALTGAPEASRSLKLLIVSPNARGLGLGKLLFDKMRSYLRECGAAGYFLLTDDACDVGFYEHMGLVRAVERKSGVPWPGVDPSTDDFHIYVYSERL
ncbi:MAG: GNAT family N-acetyltransferase [Coriobacteriaceae bacterium]|uniref:GNAT family N-acetyltransferase n=1 Tax=Tractidigestivibacter sp. TaxID=2847320 RepID=UPI002A911A13|nr:GNAT family N-acetyltransferase [Tractidigestivibacter sp.]MCI6549103.1 GNAT family N-acetyltransferase [Coriobacteriaceae bacterium]MCI7437747.1 GNAT family N-acetyltransferase [Coriobacteriaceae bacterium]MDY5271213.1 GNAT family N-acetyltransferase [Tractidigestivibacter sp.]